MRLHNWDQPSRYHRREDCSKKVAHRWWARAPSDRPLKSIGRHNFHPRFSQGGRNNLEAKRVKSMVAILITALAYGRVELELQFTY